MHAVIYIPNFHLQAALRLEPQLASRPVALMDQTESKAVVMQMTDAARAFAVAEGQTSTQAMARCGEILIRARSRAQEDAAAEILLQCAYCFSPRIESTATGVCTMDLRGLAINDDIADGDAAGAADWAGRILRALQQTHLRAQIGVAETPELAWKAAREAMPFLCVTDAGAFLASLPVSSLEAAPELLDILDRWGVRSVGSFLALGKDRIAERLGPDAVDVFDRALARESRPLKLVTPAETFDEFMEFEEPIETLEPLLFVLRRFVEQLANRLDVVYLVAGELRLRLGLSSGEPHERAFSIPSPTRDVETLFRTLNTHLENVRTDAPISSLRLTAKPGRAAHFQFGLFETALRDPNQFHETVARLGALLGSNRAGAPRLLPTHRPDAFAMDPLLAGEEQTGEPAPISGPALRRCRPQIAAAVELRGDRPVLVHSPAVRGAIARTQGPWQISGDWWDNARWSREEWEAETTDGDLCRLVRQGDEWLVDGLFD